MNKTMYSRRAAHSLCKECSVEIGTRQRDNVGGHCALCYADKYDCKKERSFSISRYLESY